MADGSELRMLLRQATSLLRRRGLEERGGRLVHVGIVRGGGGEEMVGSDREAELMRGAEAGGCELALAVWRG